MNIYLLRYSYRANSMIGIAEFLLKLVFDSVKPRRWSVYKRDRDGNAHSIFINSFSCMLTGQSAPLLMEKIFHMSAEAQRASYDVKSIILKPQPIIHDMKQYKKQHSNEKLPFKPQLLSSTSCVWFQGQRGFTEWYYRAKNACLPFLVCVATVIERAQGKDLLSLSKAKEKTNINHSSPLGPATPSLGGLPQRQHKYGIYHKKATAGNEFKSASL